MSKNPSGAYGPRITLKRVQRTPPSEIQRKVKIARFLYTCNRISCRKEIARQHMSGSNVMSARIGVTKIFWLLRPNRITVRAGGSGDTVPLTLNNLVTRHGRTRDTLKIWER